MKTKYLKNSLVFIDLSNGESNLSTSVTNPSIYKARTLTTTDVQLSNTTRLESLKLINEAFRRFSNIESTLSTQRKQSQTSSSITSNRSRYNSSTSSNYNKPNELILNSTQS